QEGRGNRLRLVESAGLALARPQRHGDDQERVGKRKLSCSTVEQPRQHPSGRPHTLILEKVDQLAQRSVISSVGNGAAELRWDAPAKAAERAVLVSHVAAEKLLAADLAYALQRDHLLHAGLTHGKRGNRDQG